VELEWSFIGCCLEPSDELAGDLIELIRTYSRTELFRIENTLYSSS
jgi:hypothetical protein